MASNDRTTEILRRLVTLVAENHLAELTVEEDGLALSIKGLAAATPMSVVVPVQAQAHVLPPSQPLGLSQTPVTALAAAVAPSSRIAVESPMVGVFYRSPAPGEPPFVNVGDTLKVGQTVGLIEAMKVYSELPTEVAGRVVEILVDNGKLVKQGQPLFYLEPV